VHGDLRFATGARCPARRVAHILDGGKQDRDDRRDGIDELGVLLLRPCQETPTGSGLKAALGWRREGRKDGGKERGRKENAGLAIGGGPTRNATRQMQVRVCRRRVSRRQGCGALEGETIRPMDCRRPTKDGFHRCLEIPAGPYLGPGKGFWFLFFYTRLDTMTDRPGLCFREYSHLPQNPWQFPLKTCLGWCGERSKSIFECVPPVRPSSPGEGG